MIRDYMNCVAGKVQRRRGVEQDEADLDPQPRRHQQRGVRRVLQVSLQRLGRPFGRQALLRRGSTRIPVCSSQLFGVQRHNKLFSARFSSSLSVLPSTCSRTKSPRTRSSFTFVVCSSWRTAKSSCPSISTLSEYVALSLVLLSSANDLFSGCC
jgi:hypothetical protein